MAARKTAPVPSYRIRWHFWLARGLGSWVIALFSAGHLSHVDVEVPEGFPTIGPAGYLVGARSDHVGGKPPGVQARPPDYNKRWTRHIVMELEVAEDQWNAFWAAQRSQIGKRYDWLAILAFAFQRDWRCRDEVFCSEEQAICLESAKIIARIFQRVNKITPVMLAVIVSVRGAAEVLNEARGRWYHKLTGRKPK